MIKTRLCAHLKGTPQSRSYPGLAPDRCGANVLRITLNDLLKAIVIQVLVLDTCGALVLRITLKDLLKTIIIQVLVLHRCGAFVLRITLKDLLKTKFILVWLQTCVELLF